MCNTSSASGTELVEGSRKETTLAVSSIRSEGLRHVGETFHLANYAILFVECKGELSFFLESVLFSSLNNNYLNKC